MEVFMLEKQCDDYYISLININPVYVWGANMEKVTPELIQKLHRCFGNSKYNADYYANKLVEAQQGSGWISDCSGMILPISGKDRNAAGYYSDCPDKGTIDSIDLKHSCLVFRGTSPAAITHVGYYCARTGEVMEMASSKKNFQHKKFSQSAWNYWGKPSFIQYIDSTPTLSLNQNSKVETKKSYLYKGIDVSGYQTAIDYLECKRIGVDYAILKIIRKDMNKDKMFETHWRSFESVNIPIFAVYNYSYATTIEKAKTDAQKVLEYLNGRKAAVCLDVEDECQMGLGVNLISIINTYQSVIEEAGLPFILYTGQAFYKSYIAPYSSLLSCKNKWIARYYKGYQMMDFADDPNHDYKPFKDIMGWQYTSSGHINGCPGNYDLDVIYSDVVAPKKKIISHTSPTTSIITNKKSTEIAVHVQTKGGNLNVRNKPKTGQIIRKLKNNTLVQIFGVDPVSGWFRLGVTVEEWISPDYVRSNTCVKVLAKELNVRNSDSKLGIILTTVKAGDVLDVFARSTNTGWYLTRKGWISGDSKYVEQM